MVHHLYINTTHLPAPEVNPDELAEVEALLAEAHAFEPIREVEDLHHVGRFVAVAGRAQAKDYSQEWPVAKARAIARYVWPAMTVSRNSSITA